MNFEHKSGQVQTIRFGKISSAKCVNIAINSKETRFDFIYLWLAVHFVFAGQSTVGVAAEVLRGNGR